MSESVQNTETVERAVARAIFGYVGDEYLRAARDGIAAYQEATAGRNTETVDGCCWCPEYRRERDRVREQYDALCASNVSLMGELAAARTELDEAKREAAAHWAAVDTLNRRSVQLREALEGAEEFIARVTGWMGYTPDEHLIASIRAVLSGSPQPEGSER